MEDRHPADWCRRLMAGSEGPTDYRLRSRYELPSSAPVANCNASCGIAYEADPRMTDQGDRMDAKQTRCSVCKHPVALVAGPGRRRAALMEDGLTLCDVCAPSGNHQPVRFER